VIPPSGDQITIRSGDHEAVVVEVGGGLRTYRAGGVDVLDGYGVDEMCSGGRGQVLAPWPNRIDGGHYRFGGADLQLALTEPAKGNASHGLVRWASWTVAARSDQSVTMTHLLHPQPGYPFTLGLAVTYSVSDAGLEVATEAVNRGDRPLPFAIGFHPYLAADPMVDTLELRLVASTVLVADERGIPVDRRPVTGSDRDFRSPRPIGSVALDDCYTDLERDSNGHITADVAGGGRSVTLWADTAFTHLMVFTGDTLAAERRRRGLAVEPMTCPPNAFRSGEGVSVLEPGAAWHGRFGISPGAASSPTS
jgi:aldose 1-epimerase